MKRFGEARTHKHTQLCLNSSTNLWGIFVLTSGGKVDRSMYTQYFYLSLFSFQIPTSKSSNEPKLFAIQHQQQHQNNNTRPMSRPKTTTTTFQHKKWNRSFPWPFPISTCFAWISRSSPHIRPSLPRTTFKLETSEHSPHMDNAEQAVTDGTSKWSCKIACTGKMKRTTTTTTTITTTTNATSSAIV